MTGPNVSFSGMEGSGFKGQGLRTFQWWSTPKWVFLLLVWFAVSRVQPRTQWCEAVPPHLQAINTQWGHVRWSYNEASSYLTGVIIHKYVRALQTLEWDRICDGAGVHLTRCCQEGRKNQSTVQSHAHLSVNTRRVWVPHHSGRGCGLLGESTGELQGVITRDSPDLLFLTTEAWDPHYMMCTNNRWKTSQGNNYCVTNLRCKEIKYWLAHTIVMIIIILLVWS